MLGQLCYRRPILEFLILSDYIGVSKMCNFYMFSFRKTKRINALESTCLHIIFRRKMSVCRYSSTFLTPIT